MRYLLLSEYNAIHSDFRGVWTTERDDQPDWNLERHKYMGKRTMMAGDGSCSLLIEDMSFRVMDDILYRRFLLHSDKDGAIIYLPVSMSSDDYGRLYQWFAARLKTTDSSLFKLDEQHNNVWYRWSLAGSDGARYQLLRLPDTTDAQIESATEWIRRSFDVVDLHCIKIKRMHDLQPEIDVLFPVAAAIE